ncbi:MAG: LuxR C-terminal-related transcriptional regulator [Candidatus Hadarchaeum sp.]
MPDNSDLSEREKEILRLVATGASNKEIARKLYISTNTVKVHLRNIFAKIGAASRTEATLYAIRERIIPPPGEVLIQAPSQEEAGVGIEGDVSGQGRQKSGWERFISRYAVWSLAGFVLSLLGLISLWARGAGPNSNPQELPSGALQSRWEARAPLPEPRSSLAAAVYDGEIYAIGGETLHGITGAVSRYDPIQDAWKELTPKPLPVADIGAAVVGGKIYVPGGRMASGQPTDVLEVYDPRLDQWSRAAPLPKPISGYALASLEGKIYLFGGWDGTNYLDITLEYDPEQDIWRERTPMPTARAYAGAAVAGGKIYVMGGYNGKEALDVNEIYLPNIDDPKQSVWFFSTPMPSARYAMGVTSVSGIIEMVGGIGEKKGVLNSLEYLPHLNNTQEFGPPLLYSWSHLELVVSAPYMYALGGFIKEYPSSQNMAYKLIHTVMFPVLK